MIRYGDRTVALKTIAQCLSHKIREGGLRRAILDARNVNALYVWRQNASASLKRVATALNKEQHRSQGREAREACRAKDCLHVPLDNVSRQPFLGLIVLRRFGRMSV